VPDELNIDDLSKDKRFDLSIQSYTPEDAAARHREITEQAKHKRRIQFYAFLFAVLILLITVGCCINALNIGSPDDKKWAAGIMGAIASSVVSGLIGFALGQKH
jgi:hypothetical protein